MTAIPIRSLISVPSLSAAHRQMVLERMLALPESTAVVGLQPALRQALAHEQHTLVLQSRARQVDPGDRRRHEAPARELDAQLDTTVGNLHAMLLSLPRVFPPPAAVGVHAQRVLDAIFPEGAGALLRLPYVEQHAALATALLRLRRQPELIEATEALGLEDPIGELEALNERYGAALVRESPQAPSAEQLKRADRQGWDNLAAVVARICGTYPTDEPEDQQARSLLLEPLRRQIEVARQTRADRGRAQPTPEPQPEPPPEPGGIPPEDPEAPLPDAA